MHRPPQTVRHSPQIRDKSGMRINPRYPATIFINYII